MSISISSGDPDELILRLDRRRGRVKGTLRILKIRDNDFHILYIPELNISGYGDTENEALEMVNLVLQDFADGLFAMPSKEMDKELLKYGFSPVRLARKNFKFNGSYIDNQGVLKEFELPENTPIENKIVAV